MARPGTGSREREGKNSAVPRTAGGAIINVGLRRRKSLTTRNRDALAGSNPLVQLSGLGQSPWLDYITRDLLMSKELERLIEQDGLRGMTTNPTIFEKAIGQGDRYDADIRRLADQGLPAPRIYEALAVADMQRACDIFQPVFERTHAQDGYVSIEVSPELAYDAEATVQEARRL